MFFGEELCYYVAGKIYGYYDRTEHIRKDDFIVKVSLLDKL